MMNVLKNIGSFLFEKDKYLFSSLFLLVLIKIIIVLIYGYLSKSIEISGDGKEYIFVAQSILNGDGFKSNENNIHERPHLGNNNYFSDNPVYTLVIVPFLYIFDNNALIILISNLLFHTLLVTLFFKMCDILGIHKYFSMIGILALIFNSSLNFYGIHLIPTIFEH